MNPLVEQNLDLVFDLATIVARRLKCDSGDLVTSGYIGLTAAAKRFNADMGATFATFASPRIEGAMLDQHRAEFGRPDGYKGRKTNRFKFHEKLAENHEPTDWTNQFLSVKPCREVEDQDYIRWATKGMSRRCKMIVNAVMDGLTHDEIGHALGDSARTVSKEINRRIRPMLKQRLEGAA